MIEKQVNLVAGQVNHLEAQVRHTLFTFACRQMKACTPCPSSRPCFSLLFDVWLFCLRARMCVQKFSMENAAMIQGSVQAMMEGNRAMQQQGLDIDQLQDDMDEVVEMVSHVHGDRECLCVSEMGVRRAETVTTSPRRC